MNCDFCDERYGNNCLNRIHRIKGFTGLLSVVIVISVMNRMGTIV